MPRGEPTKVVRLPAWLIDFHQPEAERKGVSISELLTKKLSPGSTPIRTQAEQKCACATPKFSAFATNVCTICGRKR